MCLDRGRMAGRIPAGCESRARAVVVGAVAGCYLPLVAGRAFSPDQRQAAFNVIFGLFSGLESEQLQPDLAKLPDSVMDDLAAIVRQLGTVN